MRARGGTFAFPARIFTSHPLSEFEATSGGGMVTAKVNGKRELLAISIKPEAVDPDDVEMLEDMVMAAVNEALRTAAETVEREMGKLTGGMGMPGLF